MRALQGNWNCYIVSVFVFLMKSELVAFVFTILSYFFLCSFRLMSIAEETLTEFLSKATGTAIEWIQMPGMKVITSIMLRAFRFFCVVEFNPS